MGLLDSILSQVTGGGGQANPLVNAVIGMVHKIERDMAAARTTPSILPRAEMPPQTAAARHLPRPSIAAVGAFSGAPW